MKLLIISYFSFVHCFPAPAIPKINADIDFSHQSEELRRCISETRDHFIAEVVAMGGSPSDRLPFSNSQIQQLCIATSYQISETTAPPQTTQFITEMTTSMNGIDSIIDLLQELESFKNMLNPE